MTTVLLLSSPNHPAISLEKEFRSLAPEQGIEILEGGDCADIVQKVQSYAPKQMLVFAPAERFIGAMIPWNHLAPSPITLISPTPDAEVLALLHEQGLANWFPATGLSVADLMAGLSQDRLSWEREATLRCELTQLQNRFDDRKWLDRAKGVLVKARGFGEDEAFKLLRTAAMHSNLTIGQVSRSVTEASVWAEALNRAGQLRMLSQRIVKLAAQRLAGVDVHRANRLQIESEQKAQANLDYLFALPQLRSQGDVLWASLTATKAAWASLYASLSQPKTPTLLQKTDNDANTLLQCAEELVSALEAASHRQVLRVVSLCGRQRMLVQRLAKEIWLTELIADSTDLNSLTKALTQLKSEFEAALFELDHTALSSPAIRDALTATRDEWGQLLYSLHTLKPEKGRLVASRVSEKLLTAFDDLTVSYEQSMQVIMS